MDLDFLQLFEGLSTQDSLLILAFLLVAFLLGLLTNWLLQNARIRKLETELRHKEEQLQIMGQERSRLEEELSLKEADLKRAAFELEESHAARRLLLDQNQRLQQEIDALSLDLEKTQAANRQYLSTVEDLNDQILGLKTRNAQLGEQLKFASAAAEPESGALEGPLLQASSSFADDRLAEIEKRLQSLEKEREQLRHTLPEERAIHALPMTAQPALDARQLEVFEEENGDDDDPQAPDTSSRSVVWPTPSWEGTRGQAKDDLARIDGIGPFLERKLNEAGVYTFEQISQWDADRIQEITRQIQFFDGRIEKDDWVGQAKRLLESSLEVPVANSDAGAPEPELPEDDLKVIEGIGPAIEIILKKAGIRTFELLAKTDPDELDTLLHVADPRLKRFDPGTWPAQARLAMNGEWEVLRDYQDQLRAGRPIQDEDEA